MTADSFDLQLFGEEGGGADGDGAENISQAPSNNGGADPEPAAGTEPNQPETAGTEKPGTILGGTEEEAAWDFKDVVPEGMAYDEAAAAAFTSVAKEAGLTGSQAQTLAGYGMKFAQEGMVAMARARAEEVHGWAVSAKTELGAQFDSTVHAAGTGIEAVEKVIPGLRQALDETGAGNRIELIRAFALIGNLVGEDNFRGFGSAAGTKSTLYPNTDFSKY